MQRYIDIIFKSPGRVTLVFLLSFLGMCLLYQYPHELFTRPHGYHVWRQIDGFSVVRNYYQLSMDFFHPRISQLVSDDGLELAEFPIVYYISAIGYKLLGFHEWIPRVIDLLIVLFGLWCLFRLVADVLSDYFSGLILSLLLFTSPVLIYYSIAPLPDIAGMSLALAGLYYFYRFIRDERRGFLFWSFLFYAVAGAIKPTAIISLAAIISTVAATQGFNLFKPDTFPSLARRSIIQIAIYAFMTLGTVAAWWLYVAYYRHLHHISSIFQMHANPIWHAKDGEILKVIRHTWTWTNHYFNIPAVALAALLLFFAFRYFSKNAALIFLAYIIYLFGCIAYLMVFFTQFYVHDYYSIVVLPLYIATLFVFVFAMRKAQPDVFSSARFRVTMLLFFLMNVGYASYKVEQRNTDPGFKADDHLQLTNIEPYLDSIGVKRNESVIYWGDFAPNIAFYFMNRRGWGQWAYGGILSKENIDRSISKGAKFLIIDHNQSPGGIEENTFSGYQVHKVGERDGVEIFTISK